jgi:hypothetical protein
LADNSDFNTNNDCSSKPGEINLYKIIIEFIFQ